MAQQMKKKATSALMTLPDADEILERDNPKNRVKHLVHLYHTSTEPIFVVQATTIHKTAFDGNMAGMEDWLHPKKHTGRKPVYVDTFDIRGYAASHIACERGHEPLVRYLLKNGADPNLKATIDGMTPLMVAAREGYTACVEILLEHGAKVCCPFCAPF
jgi:hypothetical protein